LKSPVDPKLEFKNKVRADKGLPPLEPAGPPPVEVHADVKWAMQGFWRLSNARPIGMNGPLRIPYSEIEAYCRLHGYDYGKRQEFMYYLEQLDGKYMEFVKQAQEEEQRKAEVKKAANKPGSR